MTKSSS